MKMRMIHTVAFALLAVLCLDACTQDLKLPDIKADNRIVLLGELTAGDSIDIRGGQSIALAAGSSLSFAIPSQLQVEVVDGAGVNIALNTYTDQWVQTLHTLPFTSQQTIAANEVYKIKGTQPDMQTVNCNVYVPNAFLANIVDTASVVVNGLNLLRVRIQIFDNSLQTNYYTVEGVKQYMNVDGIFKLGGQDFAVSQNLSLYDSLKRIGALPKVNWDTTWQQNYGRVNIYTDDERTENIKIGNAQSASRRILLSDKTINGQVYTTQVYLDKAIFLSNSDTAKGQVLLKVKSVSEDYFAYLKSYELFEPSGSFNTIAQPVKIPGNVENGIGVVGGVYLLQFRYRFDTWY